MTKLRRRMSTFCKVSLTLLVAASLSGCVVLFSNPFPASQPTTYDRRFLGKWEGRDEQGNQIWVRFESASNHEMKVYLPGDLGYQNPVFRMTTTKLSGDDYMILRLNDPSNEKGSIIARYSIEADKLTVCLLNVDKVKQAIRSGKLRGVVGNSPWGGVTITESSRNIAGFLTSPNSKNLFTCLGELKKASAK